MTAVGACSVHLNRWREACVIYYPIRKLDWDELRIDLTGYLVHLGKLIKDYKRTHPIDAQIIKGFRDELKEWLQKNEQGSLNPEEAFESWRQRSSNLRGGLEKMGSYVALDFLVLKEERWPTNVGRREDLPRALQHWEGSFLETGHNRFFFKVKIRCWADLKMGLGAYAAKLQEIVNNCRGCDEEEAVMAIWQFKERLEKWLSNPNSAQQNLVYSFLFWQDAADKLRNSLMGAEMDSGEASFAASEFPLLDVEGQIV